MMHFYDVIRTHLYYIIRNLATSCYGLPQFSNESNDAGLCRFKYQEIEVRFTSNSWLASDYAKTRCSPGNPSGWETLTENCDAVRRCNRSSAELNDSEAGGF